MKDLMIVSMLVMLLVAVQFASGQSVDEVINEYVESTGGMARIDSVKSIYMEGATDMRGNEITVSITKEIGKLSRTEFEMGSTNGFILITNKDAWTYFPMHSSAPVKLPDAAVVSLQSELGIPGSQLINYIAKGNKVKLLGNDTLNGNECYKIQLTTATGQLITYWIDAKRYLLVQTSRANSEFDGGKYYNEQNNVITSYKDYSPVDGIMIAHTIDIKTADGIIKGTTFDKIELNIPVDEALYKPE